MWLRASDRNSLLPFVPLDESDDLSPEELSIVRWVNCLVDRPSGLGVKHLYVHGPTEHGKTTLAQFVSKHFVTYFMSREHYDNGLTAETQVSILDEFDGDRPMTFLNQFMDTLPMSVGMKGSQFYRRNPVWVLFLSNKPPQDCFPNSDPRILNAFLRRLTVISLVRPMSFFNHLY